MASKTTRYTVLRPYKGMDTPFTWTYIFSRMFGSPYFNFFEMRQAVLGNTIPRFAVLFKQYGLWLYTILILD